MNQMIDLQLDIMLASGFHYLSLPEALYDVP